MLIVAMMSALQCYLVSPLLCNPPPPTKFALSRRHPQLSQPKCVVYPRSQTIHAVAEPEVIRRSANYKPNFWTHEIVMSITSNYEDDNCKKNVDELKEKVRQLLNNSVGTQPILDIIDAIQRLGVGYHYKEEIKTALDNVFINRSQWFDQDLYTISLAFRLLRQHGYDVPQSVFDKFKDQNGRLKMSLCDDSKGILSLYEASYLALEGEDFMDEAKTFASENLKHFKTNTNPTLAEKVSHALELPLHWRTWRLESKWYINIYEREDNMVPILLDLAKLDYNIVQASYQSEVKSLSRWWVDLGLQEMDFFRDRILESYFWSLEMVPEQQYGSFRIAVAQFTALVTVIDDMYDVYGTLEELLLFTDAIERWDVSAMEQLPHYMKVCYMALLNTNNEVAYKTLKEKSFDITSNQKKVWVDLCKAYILEAKWFHQKYTPTLDEYLENAMVSIGGILLLVNCYYLTTDEITKEALDCIESMPSLIYHSARNFRLVDDLGTSTDEMARGDVPKSIQCYMHEKSVSEENAREHINHLINESWKKMNKARVGSYPFCEPFTSAVSNLVRQAHCMYLYRDGHGIPDKETKDQLHSLLVEPIPIN